jgi:tRNA threonylcarbamoyladenosine modification (KEOPS) complex  Pcc1 subunit
MSKHGKYGAVVRCPFDKKLYDSLLPEEIVNGRFSLSIEKDAELRIIISAADATALKALMTSVTKLLEVAENIHNGRN